MKYFIFFFIFLASVLFVFPQKANASSCTTYSLAWAGGNCASCYSWEVCGSDRNCYSASGSVDCNNTGNYCSSSCTTTNWSWNDTCKTDPSSGGGCINGTTYTTTATSTACTGGSCVSCTPNWSCTWAPATSTTACGGSFTQTATCTDSNNCGVSYGGSTTRSGTGTNCSSTTSCSYASVCSTTGDKVTTSNSCNTSDWACHAASSSTSYGDSSCNRSVAGTTPTSTTCSPANNIGQTNSGYIQCNGSCSVSAPPDATLSFSAAPSGDQINGTNVTYTTTSTRNMSGTGYSLRIYEGVSLQCLELNGSSCVYTASSNISNTTRTFTAKIEKSDFTQAVTPQNLSTTWGLISTKLTDPDLALTPSSIISGNTTTVTGWLKTSSGVGIGGKTIALQCWNGSWTQVASGTTEPSNPGAIGYTAFSWTPDPSWNGNVSCRLFFAGNLASDPTYSSSLSSEKIIAIAAPVGPCPAGGWQIGSDIISGDNTCNWNYQPDLGTRNTSCTTTGGTAGGPGASGYNCCAHTASTCVSQTRFVVWRNTYCCYNPPTPIPEPCQVTTSPSVHNLVIGQTGEITADVTSGLGSATITQMRFDSYNGSIATVNPTSDSTSIYSTTVTGVAEGSTAVWGTADLSDGRTCETAGNTDTDINVLAPTATLTPTPIPCNSGSFTDCSTASDMGSSSTQPNMCVLNVVNEQDYKIQIASDTVCDITWTLTNMTTDYDLYTYWSSNYCPTDSSYECRPFYGGTAQEVCTTTNKTSGTYYAKVRLGSGSGKYNIQGQTTNCKYLHQVYGLTFDDLNLNGVWNPSTEPLHPGIVVHVSDTTNASINFTRTSGTPPTETAGYYNTGNIFPEGDSISTSIDVPAGCTLTSSHPDFSINTDKDVDFGLNCNVTIKGKNVINTAGAGLPPNIGNQTITLTGPETQVRSSSDDWIFPAIRSGTYNVNANQPAGYDITYSKDIPNHSTYAAGNSTNVTLDGLTNTSADIWFKYQGVTIQGHNVKADGTTDLDTNIGQNITITKTTGNDCLKYSGCSRGDLGYWLFWEIPKGTYTVSAVVPDGYAVSYQNPYSPGGAYTACASGNTCAITVDVLNAGDSADIRFKYVLAPTPTPIPCVVTISPSSYNMTVGETGKVATATVTGLPAGKTISRMLFDSYDSSKATVSPTSDSSSLYQTVVTAVATGVTTPTTAIWATAELSDGNTTTCQSHTDTDIDITVTSPPPPTAGYSECLENYYSNTTCTPPPFTGSYNSCALSNSDTSFINVCRSYLAGETKMIASCRPCSTPTPTPPPTYSIAGKLFIDADGNGKNNSEAPYTAGVAITRSPNSGSYTSPVGTGNYSITGLLAGTYTITFAGPLQANYGFTYPPANPVNRSLIVNVGPSCSVPSDPAPADPGEKATCSSGDITFLNAGVTNIADAWIQTTGADLRWDKTGVQDNLTLPSGKFVSIAGTGGMPGILFTGSSTPPNQVSQTYDWKVGGSTDNTHEVFTDTHGLVPTSYRFLQETIQATGVTPTTITSINNSLSRGIYKTADDLTISSPVTFGSGNFIILVGNNLNISARIKVPVGSTVIFSAKGNITVDRSIGETESSCTPPSPCTLTIEGLYSADNNFVADGQNNCSIGPDLRLNIAGSVIANAGRPQTNGRFINNRTLCGGNTSNPTVSFIERPDFMLYYPSVATQTTRAWQDIAP